MFAYPAIIILLWLHKTASVVAYPSDPCAIQWVNCSQNVPSLLDRTEVDLANLPSSLHCGRLDVPMDYSKPLSPSNVLTIGLAMYRPKEPKGVIFYNPGANDPAAVVAWQVALNQTDSFSGLTDFDLMMMDIRGTYSSNQLNVSLEAFNVLSGAYPSNQSDFNTFQNASAAAIQSFIDLSSPPGVIEHVGTVETVQDYESIRKALGYEQIHFLGASYILAGKGLADYGILISGSYRAAQYAYTFPKRVGRFVLDAVTPHGLDIFDLAQDHVSSVNRALLRADAYCQNNSSCPFNSKGKGSIPKAFRQVLEAAGQAPLPAPSCANSTACLPSVSPWNVRQAMLNALLGQPDFPAIFEGLRMALSGDASFFSLFCGVPVTEIQALVLPLLCNDYHIKDNTFAGFQRSLRTGLSNDNTMIGQTLSWQIELLCSAWPYPTPSTKPLNTTIPMLLVTADFDVNTPTEWATDVRAQAPNSVLVVRHGDDHVSFTLTEQPSTIITKDYLRTGTLPSARNESLVTVYTPGMSRAPIPDPYDIPTGAVAGDTDSLS